MVAAYHLIWTAYGHWLPNDPRGSTSHNLCCAKLAPLGEVHYGRKQVQPAGREIREFYAAACGLLKHDLLTFADTQLPLLGQCFADLIRKRSYTCYACAIMPDHVHLVIRKHRDQAEEMIEHFQSASRQTVHESVDFPHGNGHPVWGGPGWKVFLNTQEDIRRTIRYVNDNPIKIGRPRQEWPFVQEYDGWLPGQVRFAKPQARDFCK